MFLIVETWDNGEEYDDYQDYQNSLVRCYTEIKAAQLCEKLNQTAKESSLLIAEQFSSENKPPIFQEVRPQIPAKFMGASQALKNELKRTNAEYQNFLKSLHEFEDRLRAYNQAIADYNRNEEVDYRDFLKKQNDRRDAYRHDKLTELFGADWQARHPWLNKWEWHEVSVFKVEEIPIYDETENV